LDKKGIIHHKDKIKTQDDGDQIIKDIKNIVRNYQEKQKIDALGISVPGIVQKSGYMLTGGAIFDFYDIDLGMILEKELNLPVSVENDANSAALAEKWLGAGREFSNFVTVVVCTGIGGSIIINDKIYKGGHASAGEFGFMINQEIKNNDTRMASASLTSSVQSGLVQGYIDEKEGKIPDDLNGKIVFELADKGDKVAQKVINYFYDGLARTIFNIIVSIDPEAVLVGGGISSNDMFITELNKRISLIHSNHRDMGNMKLAEIIPCHFLNDAGIIGAAYKAVKILEKEGIK
ncbi:MAG: ROK family protein, partial [Atopostipes sp.]|nr:ROK family protein [Atopostipes sp.]